MTIRNRSGAIWPSSDEELPTVDIITALAEFNIALKDIDAFEVIMNSKHVTVDNPDTALITLVGSEPKIIDLFKNHPKVKDKSSGIVSESVSALNNLKQKVEMTGKFNMRDFSDSMGPLFNTFLESMKTGPVSDPMAAMNVVESTFSKQNDSELSESTPENADS